MEGRVSQAHRRLRTAAAAAAAVGIALGWADAARAQDLARKQAEALAQSGAATPEYIEGRVIVKYRFGAPATAAAALHSQIGSTSLRRYSLIDAELVQLPAQMRVEYAVDWYSAQPDVEYAEPDYVQYVIEDAAADPAAAGRSSAFVTNPNDPSYPNMWGLNNTGQTGGTADADIDAPEGWDIRTGAASIVVGVIDTGVDTNHEDLAANIWTNPGETAGDGIDNDGNGFIDDINGWDFVNDDNDPFDDHSHGTHVSGTVAAVGDNGIGVTGVAWAAQIMGLKFLSSAGTGSTADAISAVQYATANGAHLTSNSWGGGGFSQALKDAIEASGNAGMLFVAAAGNAGSDTDLSPQYPSSYDLDNIISIAATDHNDQLAGFSNFGLVSVDIGAPGVNILSTVPNDGYDGTFSGTSMATPHVSGVAALLHAQFPALSHLDVKDRILASGDPIAALDGVTVTGRRLNLANALEDDQTAPDAVTDLQVVADAAELGTAGAFSLTLEWTATGDDGVLGTAAFYDLRYSTQPIDDTNFDQAAQVGDEPAPAAPGTTESHTVTGLTFSTTYHFAIKVVDNVGNASGISNSATGTTDDVLAMFFDDAETADSDGKWTVDAPWGRTTEDASPGGMPAVQGGSWSWTDSPGGSYANNDDVAIVSIPFSLADATNSALIFDHKYNIEFGFDFGFVDISTNGGASWTNLATYSGIQSTWGTAQFDLSAYDGQANVQIRFRLTTDFSVIRDGWYIDDILVAAESGTRLIVERPRQTLGDPVVLNLSLENNAVVAGVDYEMTLDDGLGLLTYMSSDVTARTTGFSHDVVFDAPSGTLTGLLVDAGGGTIAPDVGPIGQHTFSTAAPAGFENTPLGSVVVDAPADPNTGMPDIYVPIDVLLTNFTLSDDVGNPMAASGSDGAIELGILNTDVDFSSEVDVGDVVSMVNYFLERTAFTALQFLIADAYKDDEINVVDVVRGVNIILGRPIGTGAAAPLVALSVAGGDEADERSARDARAIFSVHPSFGSDDSPWLDLRAEIPENVVGMQVTVRYDPSRLGLYGESLALDDRVYRLAARQRDDVASFMVYSPGNRRLEPGVHTLVRLRAEWNDPEASGSPAGELELVRAIAVDQAGQMVRTNLDVPMGRDEVLAYELGLSYPNPFTRATGTYIDVKVPARDALAGDDARVTVRIYSLRGQMVRTLADGPLTAGQHTLSWDGTNDRGATVSSGVYVLMMQAGDFVERRRIVFIR